MIEWILIILLYAIGIPIEIKEMKNDFSFFILRIVSILLTSSNVITFQTFYFITPNMIQNPLKFLVLYAICLLQLLNKSGLLKV